MSGTVGWVRGATLQNVFLHMKAPIRGLPIGPPNRDLSLHLNGDAEWEGGHAHS